MNQDKTITCGNCNQEFVWTEGEQEFYTQKGLAPPIYCMICRAIKKAEGEDRGRGKAKFGK